MHRLLAGHECHTAQQQGWGGLQNGALLQRAEEGFDLFITADQNMRYQQNLAGRRIAILELSTNKLHRIEVAADLIRAAIDELHIGSFRHLEIP
jgi:hypothetical protein